MEDLALLVTYILGGLFLLGIVMVVLAALSRKGKISRWWAISLAAAVSVTAFFIWPDSPRVAAIPVVWGILASAIALWPNSKK